MSAIIDILPLETTVQGILDDELYLPPFHC